MCSLIMAVTRYTLLLYRGVFRWNIRASISVHDGFGLIYQATAPGDGELEGEGRSPGPVSGRAYKPVSDLR